VFECLPARGRSRRDHGEITARSLGWLVGHLRRGLGGGGLCDAQELAHLLRRRGVDEARADDERAW